VISSEAKGLFLRQRPGRYRLRYIVLTMLAKALRPLPEKYHGLRDEEQILRKRYLDIIFFSEETREMIKKRSAFLARDAAIL